MSLLPSIKNIFSYVGRDSRISALENENDRSELIFSDKEDLKTASKIDKLSDIDVQYPLIKPFAYAHVEWDKDENAVVYSVIEPDLTPDDKEILKTLKENLYKEIGASLSTMQDREEIISCLDEKLNQILQKLELSLTEKQHDKIFYYIYRDVVGLGEIEPVMQDPYIEDLGCDKTGTPVFAVHSEFGSVKTDVVFHNGDKLENLVIKLSERCGARVSYSNPLLDGALPNGSRVNASLTEDVGSSGPAFSIRKFSDTPLSAIDMMNLGTVSADILAYLWICQEYNQSILIAGGTSTGKTSFLNAITSFIRPEEKIVSIEDTRELHLPHENWIPSTTMEIFGSDQNGNLELDDLLEKSFDQNPDYILVGETTEESSALFQRMSSGHPSMSTIHASSPNATVKRLVEPPISLSPTLIEAVDIMVMMTHAKGVEESARRVKSIHELQEVVGESSSARTNEAFTWTAMEDGFNQEGNPYLFDEISSDYGISKQKLEQELEQRTKVLELLQDKDVNNFDRVSKVVAKYYKNKEEVLEMVNPENDEYSLEEFIQTDKTTDQEEKNIETQSDRYRQNSSKADHLKLNSETTLGEKKTVDINPVAELQKRLKSEEE